MAKKLIYNYTFDASAKTIVINGNFKLRKLQLITNVTDGVIVYNFADPTKGGSVSFNSATDETTITLEHDTTSMSDSDELQIFVDIPEDKVEFGETYTDPVSKLRVSTPENLIDTDFEYGLQPTKWETVELVNNIPSSYTRAPGVSIPGIAQVRSTNNSEVINVTTAEDHGLSIGDPIEVRGTTSRTANGKYLITQVPTTSSFNYKGSSVQSSTGDIRTAYTTIIPGSFFTGSTIDYNKFEGINTDGANPSTLTVTTDYAHGFSTNTSLYVTNTVGKKELTISDTTTSNAPDGDPYVDTTDNDLYLPLHGLYNNQQVTISAGSGGAIPATSTAPDDPDTNGDVAKAAYEAARNWAATEATTMISNQDHSRLLFNYTGSSKYYMYNDQLINPNASYGASINQEFRWGQQTYDLYYFYNASGSNMARYRLDYNNITNSASVFTGESVDLGQYLTKNAIYSAGISNSYWPTNCSNMGFVYCSTPYNYNTYNPFIVTVEQVPTFTLLNNATTGTAPNVDRISVSSRDFSVKRHTLSGTTYVYTDNTQNTYNTTWRYTYGIHYENAGSGEVSGYCIDIFLQNTEWTDHYNDGNNVMYRSSSGMTYNNRDPLGPNLHIQVLFGLDDGHDTSNGGRFRNSTAASQRAYALMKAVADALTPVGLTAGDDVNVSVIDDNRIKIKTTDTGIPYVFTGAGTAPIKITTGQTFGIADDSYNITGVTTTTKSITANSRLSPRVLSFSNTAIVEDTDNSRYYINFPDGHGILDGQKVTFDKVSGADVTGISSGTEYYAYAQHSKYLALATSEINWNADTLAISATQASAGSYNLTINSVSGRVAAAGTVTTTTTSKVVSGTDTKFTSAYSIGDNFVLEGSSTYGPYSADIISSIVSDTSLTLQNNAGVATDGGRHFIDTKMNVRADGTFIHRPFDGGVDITAGSSPDSKVIRQTRKYFRYQSGKGIQCSMAINFNPYRQARLLTSSGTTATVTTEYPHGLTNGDTIKVRGATVSSGSNHYNGTSFTVAGATTFTFQYTMGGDPADDAPAGIVEYTIASYSNAGIRGGLFDEQNGMFYEYDGQYLYAVRRSSTTQVPGTVSAVFNSNILNGTNTQFTNHLSAGDKIVVRGQSYKVTRVVSDVIIDIQPKYRGVNSDGVIVTKTEDTRVQQSNWSIDTGDGNGPSGFNLDINAIQMAYIDYSWYGAGKIRFGFKDTNGHVKYMHDFIHNNRLNEAYMRTGNVPARYESYNTGLPTYVPSLFHWGTSVIMDGGFDDDDSYLFTASGNALSFTNGATDSSTTNANGELYDTYDYNVGQSRWYLRLSFPAADASKFSNGISLYTADGQLNGQSVEYTDFSGSNFRVYIFLQYGSRRNPPAVYPNVSNSTAVNIGAPASGGEIVDVSSFIPLVSLRLAPSVDNNLIGAVGERDIINRMQLKLNELGISVSHDSRISVILNGALSNIGYQNVGSPSLSQYVSHASGDTIQEGTTIYQFRASGGAIGANGERTVSSQTFDLTRLIDMGNSVLGGDGVYPNGPDIVTICASALDTTTVNSTAPFQVSSRISWSESQA
tara:strand:- start:254 stop:4915 length:4662 start_codon:yes stop_codon:yes gene_type:complete